jgi:predicted enzyme related to lactoylglutathione lyase
MATRGKDHQIDNIEFNVSDIDRSKAFYGTVFNWQFVDYGPTYTEFTDGRLTGGFTTGEPVRPGGPLVILYADDLAETQNRLEAAGQRSAGLCSHFRAASGSTSSIRMDTSSRSGLLWIEATRLKQRTKENPPSRRVKQNVSKQGQSAVTDVRIL